MDRRRKIDSDIEDHTGTSTLKRIRYDGLGQDGLGDMYHERAKLAPSTGSTLVKKTELIMLMEQALSELGFAEVSEQLMLESGIQYESNTVSALRKAILEGKYRESLLLLDKLEMSDKGALRQAKFQILEQDFLEELESGNSRAALKLLQQDLASMSVDNAQLHKLAGCMLCTTNDSLRKQMEDWPGTSGGKNRHKLLHDLQGFIPAYIMMADGRLLGLIEQALAHQLSNVDLHTEDVAQMPISLLTDYSATRGHIPTCTTQVLQQHSGEVWHIQFSHNGRFLASASVDRTAIIWRVSPSQRLELGHVLRGHGDGLTACCWSPDDRLLATCSLDSTVRIWESASGKLVKAIDSHLARGGFRACTAAWLPHGEAIMTTGDDNFIDKTEIESEASAQWQNEGMNELHILNDSRLLLLPCGGENRVDMWDLEESPNQVRRECLLRESDSIVACSVSADGKSLLLNMASRAVHLWSIPPRGSPHPATFLRMFRGARERQSRFVVRSCFGGYQDSYVLSGSEECKVFVWHSASGELLASLEGHSGVVNSVSWNPRNYHMFASASDDKSIHIWGLDPDVNARQQSSPMAASSSGKASSLQLPQTQSGSPRPPLSTASDNCPKSA